MKVSLTSTDDGCRAKQGNQTMEVDTRGTASRARPGRASRWVGYAMSGGTGLLVPLYPSRRVPHSK